MYKYIYTVKHGDIVSINIYQCCGVEAGGAEIIWGPGAPKLKINLNKHVMQSVWRMLGRIKADFYLY